MSSFPGSPNLLRGGIVLIDPDSGAVLRIITLQYNPETLSRTFQIRAAGAENGDHLEALRLKGPPAETIRVEAEIDATDDLEAGNDHAVEFGLHAELAALETLVYPASSHLTANHVLSMAGSIEILPQQGPLPIFVFGPKRILPIRITELSVTEEAFDTNLNPIRAKVTISMRVLTVDDTGFDSKGGGLFMTYLRAKERLAQTSTNRGFTGLGIRGIQ